MTDEAKRKLIIELLKTLNGIQTKLTEVARQLQTLAT